ncbi:abl interactor homolog [Myripristis murdjan]|uniref:abl interactor homolog n=1 Tax=Myripristis murdjan TaxID=586833 RepID=UPI0011764805|nr:abl interactor homolog [Myripristis murdjan]
MDVTSQHRDFDATEGGANKSPDQSPCITSQPTANGTLPQHTEEAPPTRSDRMEDGDSGNDSFTDSCSTNDIARLLPNHAPSALPLWKKKELRDEVSPPVCSPPPPSLSSSPPPPPLLSSSPPPPPPSLSSSPPPPLPHSTTCPRHSSLPHHHRHHHHQNTNDKRLSSSKSHASLKTDAAHIKEVAGDDCCVHCLLACLFCELWSMCALLGECVACGGGGAGCCDALGGCCCAEAAGGVACTDEACQAVLDCGILEDCCGSSDCLEICLECCSICFPA